MKELISVIIPVYKVREYLHRCVNSVLRQTYKNLEIILVDDGSPDDCGKICDDYLSLDSRVRVIHKQNQGLSEARNSGLDEAKGEYIAFVDSDDWVNDRYIEKLYYFLTTTNSDIAVCNFIRTSTEDTTPDISEYEIYEYSSLEALVQMTDKFCVQMVISWGKLYKKSLFDGIRFPSGRIHEDEFVTYKLIYNCKKVVLSTAKLYYYWQRQDSIMGSGFNIKGRLDAIDAFKERAEFFNEVGLNELSLVTYKLLFFLYLRLSEKPNKFNTIQDRKKFESDFKSLRKKLRKINKKTGAKLYYRIYYIIPKTMDLAYIIYTKIKYNNALIKHTK